MSYEQSIADIARSVDQIAVAAIRISHVAESLENDFRPNLKIIASVLSSIEEMLRKITPNNDKVM